jgi:hypothetical protein
MQPFTRHHLDQALNVSDLENFLSGAFEPIKPRPEFVQALRGRLSSPISPAARYPASLPSPILIVGGLLGSLLIVVTGIKAALSLAEAIKALRMQKT